MKSKRPKKTSEMAATTGGYGELLAGIKQRIATAQIRAHVAVSRELNLLYWQIGRDIVEYAPKMNFYVMDDQKRHPDDQPSNGLILCQDKMGLDTATRDTPSHNYEATSRDFCAAKAYQRRGELIDVIATIELTAASEGDKTHRSVDLLGRVYKYFLTRFASPESKNGGQFYTSSCVMRCLVEMLAPYKSRIDDPACGSGGMFVQSEKFVESHGGNINSYYDDLAFLKLPPLGI